MTAESPVEREPRSEEHPRVLVGTLYSGESQFPRAREALEAQTYTRFEHLVLRDLPNREAHRRLYSAFMERSDSFDLFLKLDADMVLSRPSALAELVALFRREPELDHLMTSVDDWISRSPLMGLHAFSRRCRWTSPPEDRLFVDPYPEVPGRRRVVRGDPAPLVVHAPDPRPAEAYRYGVHRALKAVQPHGAPFRFFHSRSQWKVVLRVWEAFRETGHRLRGLAVLGADGVLAGEVELEDYDRTTPALEERLRAEGHHLLEAGDLLRRLAPSWRRGWVRELRFRRAAGLFRSAAGFLREAPGELLGEGG